MTDLFKDLSNPAGKKQKKEGWLARGRREAEENEERTLQAAVQAGIIGPGDTQDSLDEWGPEWTTLHVFRIDEVAPFLLPGEMVYAYHHGGLYKHASRYFNRGDWDIKPYWDAHLLVTDRRFLAIHSRVSGEPKWAEDHFYSEVYAVQREKAHLNRNLIIWNFSERARLDGFHQRCSIWVLSGIKSKLRGAMSAKDFGRVADNALNAARSGPTALITRPASLSEAPAPDSSPPDGQAPPTPDAPPQPASQPPEPPKASGARERLAEAQALFEEGAISQEEYDNVRASILSDI